MMLYHSFILPVFIAILGLSRCQDSTTSALPPTSTPTLAVSTDGSCGEGTSFICLGSRWGDCCSPKGWCGKDANYCGAGCQSSFGNCTATAGSTSSAGSTIPSISTDGSCGGSTGFICLGSTFGDCCSEKGYCGGNSSYCSAGCQSDFGHCGSTNQTDARISTDGSCGGSTGFTCLGSTFGDCCSTKGWCGANSSYCDAGCQHSFGKCSAPDPSSTLSSSTSASNIASTINTSLPVSTVQTTGFKAGIAVASTVAFLALLSLALFLLYRRRQRLNHKNLLEKSLSDSDAVEAPSDASPPAANANGKIFPSELATVGYYQEMPANEKRTFGERVEERSRGEGS
ncbi:hypothetical protein GJ744_010016 [Endocarpon pusillum]|uniref:Chitin-binding type-1 domain-containing protein n=1 Tax=Endocarpon pusillum TaxID=364733 RepID=A0A8H7E3C1_9EURO|nr:hypothetical protein GJ744_010016 [Endocarpon pusillum]